jgi:glutamine phosphoribosylpyrophosphate amidotransferase
MEENYSWWLIEQLKKKMGVTSDRKAGLTLEKMNDGNLGQTKAGKRHLTPEQALSIALQCDLDVGEVLVRLDMEKTQSEAVRSALSSVLKRIAGAVACISLTMALMMTPASDDSLAVS